MSDSDTVVVEIPSGHAVATDGEYILVTTDDGTEHKLVAVSEAEAEASREEETEAETEGTGGAKAKDKTNEGGKD